MTWILIASSIVVYVPIVAIFLVGVRMFGVATWLIDRVLDWRHDTACRKAMPKATAKEVLRWAAAPSNAEYDRRAP